MTRTDGVEARTGDTRSRALGRSALGRSALAAVLVLGLWSISCRSAAADTPPGRITVTVRFSTGAPDPYPDFVYANGSFISHHPGDAQGRITFVGGISAFQHCTTSTDFGPYDGEHGCLAPRSATPGTASFVDLTLTPNLNNPLSPALNHTDQFGTFQVTLRDTTGQAVPLTSLTIWNGALSVTTGVDEHGQVTVPAPAGVPFVFCGAIQRRLDVAVPDQCTSPLTVGAGRTRQVDIVGPDLSATAPRGQIVGGVYLAGTHLPVQGAKFKLEPTPEGRYPLDNHYQFVTVSATFTVRIVPPDGYAVVGPATHQVTVPPGGSVEADFFVRPLTCRYVLGFAALHDAIPTTVGDCVDDEQHNPANGDGLQSSTNGLLVWRKADNFTAFTDGYRTWVDGPDGVQERLNTQRFPWEANPDGLPLAS